jgi:hypothetical protein
MICARCGDSFIILEGNTTAIFCASAAETPDTEKIAIDKAIILKNVFMYNSKR